jgi:hypothetical protein
MLGALRLLDDNLGRLSYGQRALGLCGVKRIGDPCLDSCLDHSHAPGGCNTPPTFLEL